LCFVRFGCLTGSPPTVTESCRPVSCAFSCAASTVFLLRLVDDGQKQAALIDVGGRNDLAPSGWLSDCRRCRGVNIAGDLFTAGAGNHLATEPHGGRPVTADNVKVEFPQLRLLRGVVVAERTKEKSPADLARLRRLGHGRKAASADVEHSSKVNALCQQTANRRKGPAAGFSRIPAFVQQRHWAHFRLRALRSMPRQHLEQGDGGHMRQAGLLRECSWAINRWRQEPGGLYAAQRPRAGLDISDPPKSALAEVGIMPPPL
jgi:hypothetical protein